MKKILVIAPMDSEERNMQAALAVRHSPRNSYTVKRGHVGKVYAAAATALALAEAEYDLVAVVGYAAASDAFSTGEVVCPRRARYHDVRVPEGLDGVDFLTNPYDTAGTDDAQIFTGDAFVGPDEIREIKSRYGCSRALFDMESTAVCQICANRGKPVIIIKMVSDTPEKGCTADSFERFVAEHTDFGVFVDILEKE